MNIFSRKLLLLSFGLLMFCQQLLAFKNKEISFYISVKGSDKNTGTEDSPFGTIDRAVRAIKSIRVNHKNIKGSINVIFRKGTYFISKPVKFSIEDSGTPDLLINFKSYPNEEVVISGGKPITGWQNVHGNLWKVNLPEVKKGQWYFRQLFANNMRMIRARMPNAHAAQPFFLTTGPLSAYAADVKPWDIFNRSNLFFTKAEAFCGFGFSKGDVLLWDDLENAEVLTHHSWESSWQTVRKVDTVKSEIYFNTPSWCPIGFFGNESLHSRYIIENCRAALDEPGEWYLNRKSGELYYLGKPGEDVNKMAFIAPVLEELMIVEGTPATPVQNLSFSGLSFYHNNYPMDVYINSIHIKDEASKPFVKVDWRNFIKKQYPDWPVNFNPGYMEPQAAINTGQAIVVKDAANIHFNNCTIAHTGNYGLYIAERCHNTTVSYCHFFDLGAGGIKVGLPVIDVLATATPFTDLPFENIVSDNTIHDGGLTIPGCVGIWVGQSRDNKVIHNELYNLPYSGISMGWTWANVTTYTQNNLLGNNNIHNVLQTLTDGGGIYTLGKLNGSEIRGNYIHNIIRHSHAAGGGSQGIFFDESSQGVIVDRNVINGVKGSIAFNGTKKENMTWGDNFFNDSSNTEAAKVISKKAGPRR